VNLGSNQVKLYWERNIEADIAGYIVYYNGFNGYSFTDFVDVGTDTTYTLTGVSVNDVFAVTAYDNTYNTINEINTNIVNDNMALGFESWFTYAQSECNAITLSMSVTEASCFTCDDGTATAVVSMGTAPYTYTWQTSPVQDSSTAINLLPGVYIVTVSDFNGCVLVDSIEVTYPTNSQQYRKSEISFYPNPCDNHLFITGVVSIENIEVYDVLGHLVWQSRHLENNSINLSGLKPGIYIIHIREQGKTYFSRIIKN